MSPNNAKNNISVLEFNSVFDASSLGLGVVLWEDQTSTEFWHKHHDYVEILIALSGSACNDMDDESCLLHPGDVMMFAPQSTHRYRVISKFRYYNILFLPQMLKLIPGAFSDFPQFSWLADSPGGRTCSLHLNEQELAELIGIVENMRREYQVRSSGWKEIMVAEFNRALVFIFRHARGSAATVEADAFQIGKAIRFMEENLCEPCSIKELCKTVKMSESSFRQHFCTLTGLTPIEYLIRLRLRRAMMMMLYSDRPIAGIALDCGFSDGNYFTRQFRMHLGIAPREFRTACHNGKLQMVEELKKLALEKHVNP